MAGWTQSYRLGSPNTEVLGLPSTRRFTLHSIVMVRMPASSECTLNLRWMVAVSAPAAKPQATAAAVAASGCRPATSSAAATQPPSGSTPSLERSGRLSTRNGIITPTATRA